MPDMLQYLRMHNVFGNEWTQPQPYDPSGQMPPNQLGQGIYNPAPPINPNMQANADPTDIAGIFKSIYSPEHTAEERYNKIIAEQPIRNKPGFLRKLGAAAVGMAGGNPDDVNYAPYKRELEDWGLKLKPAQDAATLERTGNTQERIAANELATRVSADRRISESERAAKEREDNNRKKTEIAERRAAAYIFDKEHPDWKAENLPGTTLKYRNPKDMTQVYDTGIKTGDMDEADRINLQTRGRLSEIAASGSQARQTAVVQGGLRQEDIGARADAVAQNKFIVAEIDDPANPGRKKTVLLNQSTGEIKPIAATGVAPMPRPAPAQNPSERTRTITDADGNVVNTEVIRNNPNAARIRVEKISTGQTGTILASDFDPKIYVKVK